MKPTDFMLRLIDWQEGSGLLTVQIAEGQRFQAGAVLNHLENGLFKATIQKWFPQRSLQANRKFHGVIWDICEFTGMDDFEAVKQYVKHKAIAWGVYKEVMGERVPISEAECDTKQEGILIDVALEVLNDLQRPRADEQTL